MAKLNKLIRAFTHEGARGKRFTPEMELKRALMNCLLWEDQFYEDGVSIADRIKALVPQVEATKVAALAIAAREQMKLRHAPLLVVREMARHEKHRVLVADTLARVIQRPDEMTELLAIYTWRSPGGEKLTSCTIITTAANELLAPLHNRMPVILAPDEWPRWLGETPASDDELTAMLRPYKGDDLHLWPVSKRVVSVKNNDATLVEPVSVAA